MIGTGSVIITHTEGWSACREAILGMEHDIRPDKTAKRTLVVSMTGLFDCVGKPTDMVHGLFKLDNGDKVVFTGNIKGKTRIEISGETNKDFETIFKNIEKWQEHYKGS